MFAQPLNAINFLIFCFGLINAHGRTVLEALIPQASLTCCPTRAATRLRNAARRCCAAVSGTTTVVWLALSAATVLGCGSCLAGLMYSSSICAACAWSSGLMVKSGPVSGPLTLHGCRRLAMRLSACAPSHRECLGCPQQGFSNLRGRVSAQCPHRTHAMKSCCCMSAPCARTCPRGSAANAAILGAIPGHSRLAAAEVPRVLFLRARQAMQKCHPARCCHWCGPF